MNITTTKNEMNQTIKLAIILATKRAGYKTIELDDIELISSDISSEFPQMKEEDITKALRNGGLGMYGDVYRLGSLQICIWIRQYIKDNPVKTEWQTNPYPLTFAKQTNEK